MSAAQPEGNELAGTASLLPAWRGTRPRWFANRLSATRRLWKSA